MCRSPLILTSGPRQFALRDEFQQTGQHIFAVLSAEG